MKFRYTLILHLLLYVVLCSTSFAQNVAIPDANLRNAIREALNLSAGVPITAADMRQLTALNAAAREITNLTGLEYATNLTELRLGGNPITDIRPLAHLTQLTFLRLNECWTISDISPLAHLKKLEGLDLDRNLIVNISPLAGLTKLEELDLRYNRIIDVSPLANLTQLNVLRLNNNQIIDISPLENLANLEHLDTSNNPIFDPDSPIVEVPDPNLRTAIRETLNLLDGVPLTQASMRQLIRLYARNRQITALTGLEHALNLTELNLAGNNISDLVPIVSPITNLMQLTELYLSGNQIVDISPLAGLTKLEGLSLRYNRIIDVSPLAKLTQLNVLRLDNNRIVDISPLANLTQLTQLWLDHNKIKDVRPLANLTRLEILDIRWNSITEHSPLDGLSLDDFRYDETCDIPPSLPLQPRLEKQQYPFLFQAWGGEISNRPDLSYIERLALHDLWMSGPQFGLSFQKLADRHVIRGRINDAIRWRDELLALNPNMIFLVDIRLIEHWEDEKPEDWPHWVRDTNGNRVSQFPGAYMVDFSHPEVQDRIVQQAVAVSNCGLYDGIFFDYWHDAGSNLADFIGLEAEQRARLAIIRRIRDETRSDLLIMGNTNHGDMPITGSYMNGSFMETPVPGNLDENQAVYWLNRTQDSLQSLQATLREPHIIGIRGKAISTEPPDSRDNRRWMRAITTLSLTRSNGYFVYSHVPHHKHYWYTFWDIELGRPVGEKGQLYKDRSSEQTASAIEIPGLYMREFTNGWAVYNHSEEPRTITLPEEVQGVASGSVGTEHTLPNLDGEIYLRVKINRVNNEGDRDPKNPADVNGDGAVNILDLVVVAQAISTGVGEGDVNGDGVVNVFDLVFVAGAIGGGGAAPSASSLDLSIISAADVAKWLAQAQSLGIGDADLQRGIRFLQQLLAALTPKKTALLPNYPNPFNPETWIPYRLAQEAEVAITIYDTKGALVRQLALGNQEAGYYAERGKAAYWDGRNERGEAVASGIYIYQFRAGDYAASRRMVILK